MKSKKPTIYPSQFIQELVKFNDWETNKIIDLNIRRFRKLIEETRSEYEFDFDYFELAHYAKRFHSSSFIIEETEIHLHAKMSDTLLKHLEWYNRIYQSNDDVVSGKIYSIWKEIK